MLGAFAIFLLVLLEEEIARDARFDDVRILNAHRGEIQSFLTTVTAAEKSALDFIFPLRTGIGLDRKRIQRHPETSKKNEEYGHERINKEKL